MMVRVCTNIGLVKVFLDSENCNYALILYIECHTLVNVKQCYYIVLFRYVFSKMYFWEESIPNYIILI